VGTDNSPVKLEVNKTQALRGIIERGRAKREVEGRESTNEGQGKTGGASQREPTVIRTSRRVGHFEKKPKKRIGITRTDQQGKKKERRRKGAGGDTGKQALQFTIALYLHSRDRGRKGTCGERTERKCWSKRKVGLDRGEKGKVAGKHSGQVNLVLRRQE